MTESLHTLANLHGLGREYYDYKGELRTVSTATLAAIVRAMGIRADDAHALDLAVGELQARDWTTLVPAVLVLHPADLRRLPVSVPQNLQARTLSWSLRLEAGVQSRGECSIASLERAAQGSIARMSFDRVLVPLPADLPAGYHDFSVTLDSGLSGTTRVIVAPQQCYLPTSMSAGKKLWGLAVQLYTLRSAGNWGIGDFKDLRELIKLVAPRGCSMVGVNPLHALSLCDPANCSPYSPSSRYFLNALYIAIEEVPEFAECEDLQQRTQSDEFQASLMRLRAADNVQYDQVAQLKLEALHELYDYFRIHHLRANSARANAFKEFIAARGNALFLHALHGCLDAHFRKQGPQYWGWPAWPEEYRMHTSAAVHLYAKEHAVEIQFYQYLQWLADEQLAQVQRFATAQTMEIGLYGDIAVGASAAGSETWANRVLYLQQVSIGAPPDPLALKGQAWGVPPQLPLELRAQKYEPFIDLVRSNMRHMGALRIDHVMALFRLWWVPASMSATEGTYVHYPLRDLLGILALESIRNHCLVIGEDLGTVPDEIRDAMEHHRILHYKVLFFEKDTGGFKLPQAYEPQSLATVTTHDLPTLRGWWEGDDLELRDQLGLYPSSELAAEIRLQRSADRRDLMEALVQAGLWRWEPWEPLPEYSNALARAIQLYLGLSSALLVALQMEDLLGMRDAVNVPGTHLEHANWQRKLSATLSQSVENEYARELFRALSAARNGFDPNA